MNLDEAFIGVNPEVGHLRIFGCPVYIHVPKDKMTVSLQRLIEYTSQDQGRSKLDGM